MATTIGVASGFSPNRLPRTALVAVAVAAAPLGEAAAHPHVLVTARAEIVFGEGAVIDSIRHIWQFDPAFSAYAVQGYDADNDGVIRIAELAPLAQINVESLAEFAFFTWLTKGEDDASYLPPSEYWLDIYDGRLTLFYSLPLAEPMVVDTTAILQVYDPEYFVAFTFDSQRPVTLVAAPENCAAQYRPPQALDATTVALLAAIPADQRELPPDLAAATDGLENTIEIACE